MTIATLARAHLDSLDTLAEDAPESGAGLPESCLDLPPLLRALLVADGTVTTQLAAAFGEQIEIEPRGQGAVTAGRDIPQIEVATEDQVFFRAITLAGRNTGRHFARAFSLLNSERIEPALFEQLIQEQVGMGEILRNAARGSYREVIHISRDKANNTASRFYVVFLHARPAILINEVFGVRAFSG